MSAPRRALISVTSAQASLFNGKETTGLFISEALHPYNVLTAAGFEVDLASETGTYTPDWLSQQPDFLNGEDLAIWNDVDSEFRRKLDNMPRASELDGSRYGVFYASAGHAALIDYPTASSLQKIASQVWANGGIVSSVCHGPAIFANMVDLATGEPLIKGKRITGFTSEAETTMGIMEELKSWNSELVEDLAARLGAKCKSLTTPRTAKCAAASGQLANQLCLQMNAHPVSGMTSTLWTVASSRDRTLPVLPRLRGL